MINIKIIIINFLLYFYYIFNFEFIIRLIELIGGPLFTKIFQSFNNLKQLSSYDAMAGSIGNIEIKNKIVKKSLKYNIHKKFKDSFYIFKKIIKFNNFNLPFYYEDYYNINMNQLNLHQEANNSVKLTQIFKNIKRVHIIEILKVTDNFHESILIEAFTINKFLKMNNNDKNIQIDIYKLLNLSYYLMLTSNFFHCDWHFGNFLVNFDNENRVILYILDTGLVGKLDNNKHIDKLKVLLRTNMLKPEPINIIKFLAYINLNKNANIKNFIKDSKLITTKMKEIDDSKNYKNILIKLIKNASNNNLKLPIVIFYMFQAIIFLNNHNQIINDELLLFSKQNGFYTEIEKYLYD